MKRESFRYQVITQVSFTEEEVRQLSYLSKCHYDDKCRRASESGGILVGIKNSDGVWDCTNADLQLLCKISEFSTALRGRRSDGISGLYEKIRQILQESQDEHERINAQK